jgi:hypothetical protein
MSLRSGRSKRKRGVRVYPTSIRAGRVSYGRVVSYKVEEGVKERTRKGATREVIA